MCDAFTEAENETYLETLRLTRREAGVSAGATVAVMLTGCASPPAPAASLPPASPQPPPAPPTTAEPTPEVAAPPFPAGRMVTITTPDGEAEAFFVTPERGQHPGVLVWPDVAGLRDAFKTMATRLAAEGYAVLVVNQYYRSTRMPLLSTFSDWRTEEGQAKIGPMRQALTPEGISRDGSAFVAWLDQQREVDERRKIATSGYCMGGPYTFRTAAAVPERVGVVASFHGGGLVTGEPTSPHALLSKMKAAALICIAENDDARDPAAKTTLRQAAEKAGVSAEIEVYPGHHGFCVIDAPVYDQEQSERAWVRMLATFERYL